MHGGILMLREGIVDMINSPFITVLFSLILFDIALGITKAVSKRCLNSHIGLTGLLKHTMIMILLVAVGTFAPIFNLEVVFQGLMIFYIVQYIVSVLESFICLDLPIPKFLYNTIKKLEENNERWEDDED